MCGIFGGIKNFNKDKVRLLGVLNINRGNHGAGLFNGEHILKSKDDFQKLCNMGGYDFIEQSNQFLIGHTRYATHGAKTENNAHPFQSGNIVGVHNGQIRNFVALKKKYNQEQLQVDSEIIFYLLDTKGVEGLKELIGYYTVIWYDMEIKNKIFMIQHECDLAYCRTKDSLYFCSDIDDLYTATGYEFECKESLEDTLYEIDIQNLKIKTQKIKGLPADSGYNYSKIKGSYNGSYEYKAEMGGWVNTLDNSFIPDNPSDDDYEQKSFSDDSLAINREYDFWLKCPCCNEYLTLQEFHKEVCGTCRHELSGTAYQCMDCENIMMLEELIDNQQEVCIFCEGEICELVKD